MQRELPNRYLPGTIPVLLIFAARLGLQVTAVELVGIDTSGKVAALDAHNTIGGTVPSAPGARIQFSAPGDPTIRSLVYLDMRLSDRVLDPSSPEGRFFQSLGSFDTLIKSAVYLLHRDGFAELCSYILDHSSTIIQDDSGMPFRLFDRHNWDSGSLGL
jgi:hypothetical protein